MATKGTPPTLAEFSAAQPDKRSVSWCDTLPEDVQRQLIETECSTTHAVAWLKALGHTEATVARVDNWRRRKRDDRDA